MNSHKIYWLSPNISENDFLPYGPDVWFDVRLCDLGSEHAKSNKRSTPLSVVAPIVPRYDFQWTTYGECIVNETVKQSFENARFSGVAFRPARAFTSSGDEYNQPLYELLIEGWGGVASAASGIEEIESCPFCGHRVYSSVTDPASIFDFDEWDGSDVFMIWPMPRYVMVVGSVRDFILTSGFSGVEVRLIVDFPKTIAGTNIPMTFTPGSVGDYFSGARGSEIFKAVYGKKPKGVDP